MSGVVPPKRPKFAADSDLVLRVSIGNQGFGVLEVCRTVVTGLLDIHSIPESDPITWIELPFGPW